MSENLSKSAFFEGGWSINLSANFIRKRASSTNCCWSQKTRVIVLSCGIKISAVYVVCFFQNVTTLRSGVCYRKSVCLSSVCNVRAPYSGGWTFRQYFFTAMYLGHPLTSVQNFMEMSQRNPSVRGIKCKRGSIIERWWTYRRQYLINGTRYDFGYS